MRQALCALGKLEGERGGNRFEKASHSKWRCEALFLWTQEMDKEKIAEKIINDSPFQSNSKAEMFSKRDYRNLLIDLIHISRSDNEEARKLASEMIKW